MTGDDHGDNLWGLSSSAGDKMYRFGDKTGTKESVTFVHGTFPLNLSKGKTTTKEKTGISDP